MNSFTYNLFQYHGANVIVSIIMKKLDQEA